MIFSKSFNVKLGRTELHFGIGSLKVIPKVSSKLGDKWCLLTTKKASGLDKAIEFFKIEAIALNVEIIHLNIIQPNPDVEDLEAVRDIVAESDVLIAMGGGSVMDAGKALAVAALSDKSFDQLLAASQQSNNTPRKPLILVPTTSGTGSELSFGAIISSRKNSFKGGIRGEILAPDYAIVDPELTLSSPKSVTAETGFDIFTHSFESLLSSKATTHSRMNSLLCIDLVGKYLPIVLQNLNDIEGRTALSYASCMIGLNLSNVGTCLPHRLQYPIGGELPESSHPQGLAWIYPVWMKYLYPYAKNDVEIAFALLGLSKPKDENDASHIIKDWIESLGINTEPKEKLNPEELSMKVQGNLKADPIEDPESKLQSIYKDIFE